MARQWRNQGQVHSDGQQEAHRDADGEVQDRGARDQDEGLQQGGSHQLLPHGMCVNTDQSESCVITH